MIEVIRLPVHKMVENVIVAMKYHQKSNFKIPIALVPVLEIVNKFVVEVGY